MADDADNVELSQNCEQPAGGQVDFRELVQRYCPVLHLHHKEKHFPCSAEWFIERAELRHMPNGLRNKEVYTILVPEGELTQELLIEKQTEADNPKNLQLYIDPKYGHGVPAARLDDVPIYAHVKTLFTDDRHTVEAYEINYMTLYAFNGTYPVCGLPFVQAGSHPGDWEHVTVRVGPAGELQGVWYNTHRNRDGVWMPEHAVARTSAGRPIVFVALHGHGIYPCAALQHRVMYVANDKTSAAGPVWSPKKVVLIRHPRAIDGKSETVSRGTTLQLIRPTPKLKKLRATQEVCCKGGSSLPDVEVDEASLWTVYGGFWGNVVSPNQQPWYRQPEPPVSRTYWQRVLHFIDEKPLPPTAKSKGL